MFVVTVDFKEAPNIMNELTKWYDVIADFAHSLPSEVQEALQKRWMNSLLSFVQNSTDRKESETEALPSVLPRGLLETNLGIPVMVVCTHTDVIVIVLHSSHTQAKSKTLTSLKVDFIQHALRSHCLFYGSSLIYLNTATRTNLSIATNHVLSILFPGTFVSPPPNFSSQDEVFIPAGSDNSYLTADLLAGTKLEGVSEYNRVIELQPKQVNKTEIRSTPVISEEAFFASLVDGKEETTPRKSRKTVGFRPDGSGKVKSGFPSGPTLNVGENSGPSSQMNTTSFFQNLMNGGGSVPLRLCFDA
ncbi:hypothetical protein WA538_004868 [Blastocystis sp. DL]